MLFEMLEVGAAQPGDLGKGKVWKRSQDLDRDLAAGGR
jgi:hypothetical protein